MKQLHKVLQSLDRDDIIKTTKYCFPYHVVEGCTLKYIKSFDEYGVPDSARIATFYAYFERNIVRNTDIFIVVRTQTDILRDVATEISAENTTKQIMNMLGWSEVIYDKEDFFRSMCLFTKLGKILHYEYMNDA